MGVEVLSAVKVSVLVFCAVKPCGRVVRYHCLRKRPRNATAQENKTDIRSSLRFSRNQTFMSPQGLVRNDIVQQDFGMHCVDTIAKIAGRRMQWSVPQQIWLVDISSFRRPRINLREIHVRYMDGRVALELAFIKYFAFNLSVIIVPTRHTRLPLSLSSGTAIRGPSEAAVPGG